MDLRNRNLPTTTTSETRAVKRTTGTRPSTVSVAHRLQRPTGLPDGSKSLSKIHPLGAIPKYLQKHKQTQAKASSSSEQEASLDTKVEPPAEQLQTVATVSEAQLEAEYKQQTIDRLERRVQELLGELGFREQRISELESNLGNMRHVLAKMHTLMQHHLKAQQPVVKKIAEENKVLLLLQMILEQQSHSKGTKGE